MAFALESPAFDDGDAIPDRHARGGQNVSPPLLWKEPPSGTKSYLLVVEDPDAPSGMFRHWGVCDIEAGRDRLPEGGGIEGLRNGVNDFGNARYDGPQPPRGHGVHHYHFRLFALDAETLDCDERAGIADMLARARPHVIGEARLVGTYERR